MRPKRKTAIFSIALAVLACSLVVFATSSCTGYKKRWDTALTGTYHGMDGPWEGTWKSSKNGHTGGLKCIVTPLGEDQYEFDWWASWGKLSADYQITSVSKPEDGYHLLVMDFDLGKLGGVYRMEGKATPTVFDATYSAKVDAGALILRRPEPPSAP